MNDITEPLILAFGSHDAGSGRGCAMNVISWENGDTEITDYPACSDRLLARLVQQVNDSLADDDTRLLSAEDSLIALELGHATVGTNILAVGEGYDALLRKCYARAVAPKLTGAQQVEVRRSVARVMSYHHGGRGIDTEIFYGVFYAAEELNLDDIYYHSRPAGLRAGVMLVRDFIAAFKELAGITSPVPDPEATACAVRKMYATV